VESEPSPVKEYVGVIWIGTSPVSDSASLLDQVKRLLENLKRRYGQGHAYTLHNEEDADRPR